MFDENNNFKFNNYHLLPDITIIHEKKVVKGKWLQNLGDDRYIAISCENLEEPNSPKVCLYKRSEIEITEITKYNYRPNW